MFQATLSIHPKDHVLVRIKHNIVDGVSLLSIGVNPPDLGVPVNVGLADHGLDIQLHGDPSRVVEKIIDPLLNELHTLRVMLLVDASVHEPIDQTPEVSHG